MEEISCSELEKGTNEWILEHLQDLYVIEYTKVDHLIFASMKLHLVV
jgi:hypothetical protein